MYCENSLELEDLSINVLIPCAVGLSESNFASSVIMSLDIVSLCKVVIL